MSIQFGGLFFCFRKQQWFSCFFFCSFFSLFVLVLVKFNRDTDKMNLFYWVEVNWTNGGQMFRPWNKSFRTLGDVIFVFISPSHSFSMLKIRSSAFVFKWYLLLSPFRIEIELNKFFQQNSLISLFHFRSIYKKFIHLNIEMMRNYTRNAKNRGKKKKTQSCEWSYWLSEKNIILKFFVSSRNEKKSICKVHDIVVVIHGCILPTACFTQHSKKKMNKYKEGIDEREREK